jgi:hypothetical protein
MRLIITYDAAWEARLDGVTKAFSLSGYRNLFDSRNYGEGLRGIAVILMCRDPNLKFKQRIRFVKKNKTLYMDIMLDLDQMRQANDDVRKKIVAERLADEVPTILCKYSIPDFDEARFVKDMKAWLKKIG